MGNQVDKIFKDKQIDIAEDGTSYYFLLPREGTTVKMACNMCNDGHVGSENDSILAEFK